MKAMNSLFGRLLVLAFVAAAPGCHARATAGGLPSPSNVVAVTPQEVRDMKVVSEVVDEQDVDDTVLTSGKVVFDDQRVAHVYSPVSGKVVRIGVQLGQRVKKGDLLAVIESPDVGVATSDVGKARADLIAAEHDFERQKEMLAKGATSQRDAEQAEDNYRKAKAEMDRAQQKARLFRSGDVVGQTYTLRSEIDGEVFMKAVSPGIEVAGQYAGGSPLELFTVGEADRVWVLADVFAMDIPRVKIGARVSVTVESFPGRTFEGAVDWVSASLDKETRAAKLRCTFDNAERLLKPEMFATVQVSVAERRALAIPRSAVLRLGEQTVVFVETSGGQSAADSRRFERVPVTVDEGEGSRWLTVDHGLEKGQRVATSGVLMLASKL